MKPTDKNGSLNNAIPGINKDFDWMQTEWELINRQADYYLDKVNASYETQKLQNKYLDLLNEAQGSSAAIQDKISKQMKEQLEYLRKKDELSAYDVAYANAQLEILQKRIALEEAQQNKNQMRLRRDSQGNYRYQYVANKEDTRGKENDLLDAQNNAYNLSKEQMKQTQADALAAMQQMKQQMIDIWNDVNLTQEEKMARSKYITDDFEKYIKNVSEQLGVSEKNIINDFIGMTDMLIEENQNRVKDIYDQVIAGNKEAFDQVDTRWSTSLTDWLYNVEEFLNATEKMYADLTANGNQYKSEVKSITNQVSEDYGNIANTIKSCTDATNDLAAANKKFIDQIKEDAGEVANYNQRLADYQKQIDDATNKAGKYQKEIERLQAIIKEKEAESAAIAPSSSGGGNSKDSSKGGSSSSGGGSGGKSKGKGFAGSGYDKNTLAMGIAGAIWLTSGGGGWGNDPIRHNLMRQKFGSSGDAVYNAVQSKFNNDRYGYKKPFPHGSSYYKKFAASKFDTGGYTGHWTGDGDPDSNDGKLAFLHQKELVLNEKDTENMLKIVQTVRAITTSLKDQMFDAASASLGQYTNVEATPQELQQKVEIDATFPNVHDASEIEKALLGLTDQASQYALRFR